MKKISIIILATLSFSMIFSACKKYEEGPALTFRTPKQRVVGTWSLEEARYNNVKIDFNNLQGLINSFNLGGMDMDSIPFDLSELSLKSIKLNLEKEGDGQIKIEIAYQMLQLPAYNQDITWSFDDKKDALIFTTENSSDNQSFKILKLTKNELWLERTDTNNGVASIVNFEFEKIKD